ncbi:MAG: hypothetical protein OXI20_20870 [Rhodospirillales bacterium]|nr:hypothetical protein [Rhodospirillales bacterium]
MTPSGAGRVIGVLAGVVAAPVLMSVLAADPALAAMDMPVPLEQLLPTFPGAEPSCCWDLDDIDPFRVLAVVTLYVMVCHALLWGAFKLIGSVSAFVAEEFAWLMGRRR